MPRLNYREVQKIVQLFDNEIMLIPRLSKIERLKLRRQVINVVQPALKSPIATPQLFMGTVEDKLHRVVRQFLDSHGFRVKLAGKVKDLFERAAQPRVPAPMPDTVDTE